MFSTFSRLIAGGILAILSQIAGAQTLTDIQELMKQGKMPQALKQAEHYTGARPRDAQGPFMKGLILTEMGRLQEAIAIFTDLTERFPELPEPYNNLAVLYARQKQYDKAQAALEMAIRTHPSYAIAHENLGDIYARLASLAYDKALQIDSSNRTMQTKLSMIKELVRVPENPARSAIALAENERAPEKGKRAEPEKPEKSLSTPPQTTEPDKENSATNSSQEITKIIRDWAAAWSRKDVPAYLAFYSSDFQTPKGVARKKWETERRQRIDKPGTLQVTVSEIKVSASVDRATARFRQNYVSAALKSQTSKTLVFVKSGDRWLILIERVN
jgi:tetratricopeptide (TPR) repeat protein